MGQCTTARVTFAALGDSTTEGIGDPLPGGGWRGWAALLASGLAPAGTVRFVNVAASGATTRQVRAVQLGPALAVRPTIASVLVGVNDTLRGGFDPDRIAVDVEATIAALRGSGATVLTARMPDPGRMFGLPDLLRRPLSDRAAALNRVLDSVAHRHGTLHLDLADHPRTYDPALWSLDRLHLREHGHRFLARGFAELLLESGWPVHAVPSPNPAGGAALTPWDHAWWLATQGTAWCAERCTDLLPYLAGAVVGDLRRRATRSSRRVHLPDTSAP